MKLEQFYKGYEIKKTSGEDSINIELFQCASQHFIIKFLRYLNNIKGQRRMSRKLAKRNYNSSA
jgi:hypothetical protein